MCVCVTRVQVDQLKKGIFTIQESTMMTDRELDADDARRADAAVNTFAVTVRTSIPRNAFSISTTPSPHSPSTHCGVQNGIVSHQ